MKKEYERLLADNHRLVAENVRLREVLESIIDDAQEAVDNYAERWCNYRKEVQEENFARVKRARDVLGSLK